MTFDDQLKRAFDTLTDHLRAEIERQVQTAMDELSVSARAATAAAVEAAASNAPTVMNIPSPVPEPAGAGDTATVTHLRDAIRTIDGARSLTEILDALIAASAHDGMGAGVWLVRGGVLTHWRSNGIDQPDAEIPLDAQRALAEAARTNAIASDDGLAAPLVLATQVVAVLYVTSRKSQVASPESQVVRHESQVASHETEILARHAASRLEAVTAFKTARALTDRTDPAQAAAAADEADVAT